MSNLKELISDDDYELLLEDADHRCIPANRLTDDEYKLNALPRFLTYKEYMRFVGEVPHVSLELKLAPEVDEHTKLRIALKTALMDLLDENHYYQLESEVKGLGDVARMMLLEGCLESLKTIVGDKKEKIFEEFEAYNQRKIQEYWEKQDEQKF